MNKYFNLQVTFDKWFSTVKNVYCIVLSVIHFFLRIIRLTIRVILVNHFMVAIKIYLKKCLTLRFTPMYNIKVNSHKKYITTFFPYMFLLCESWWIRHLWNFISFIFVHTSSILSFFALITLLLNIWR